MKIKSLLGFIPVIFCVALLFIPLPAIWVRVCYFVELAYVFVILGICIFAAVKKNTPGILARMILYFTLFSLTMFITTTRFILLENANLDEIVFISRFEKIIFENSPIAGYIFFGVGIFLVNYSVYKININNNGDLNGSVRFLRGTVNAITLITLAAIMASCVIGVKKLDLNILDALKLYLPYCCTQYMFYSTPVLFCAVAVDILSLGEKRKAT